MKMSIPIGIVLFLAFVLTTSVARAQSPKAQSPEERLIGSNAMANADNGLDRYHYAREKLWQAVDILVGDGDIQRRLKYAAVRPQEDLAIEDRADFEDIKKILEPLSAEPPRLHLTSEDGAKLARRILSLYAELRGGI